MFNSNYFFKRFFIFIVLISISALSISSSSSNELQFTFHQFFYNDIGMAAGDVDGDSDFDLLITFTRYMPPLNYCRVYLNDGNGNLMDSGQLLGTLNQVGRPYLGDFDSDGDQDAIIIPKVYFNDGNGIFTDSGQTIISRTYLSKIAIGDLDNDGDLDFINSNESRERLEVLLNDGNGIFTSGQYFGLIYTHEVDLADVDNDGDLDLGTSMNIGPTLIYLNNGDATFTKYIDLGGTFFTQGGIKFADFNGDGLIDLAEGNIQGYNRIFFNSGNNQFIDSGQKINPTEVTENMAVCDIDNDGDIDLICSDGACASCIGGIRVFINDGNGYFNDVIYVISSWSQEIGVADFDNDSDLDLTCPHLLLNNISDFFPNTPPNEPTNLSSSIDENQATLMWEDGNDLQTPLELLTYNLRIGSNPGGNDIFYSEIGPENTTPSFGNCWHTFQKILNLQDGKYYWSVQTVDTGFMRSNWYPEQVFYVGMIEADVDIDPDTLNLKSKGKWITCYIELPDGYDVNNIDINSVTLHYNDNSIEADWGEVQGNVCMVKFNRNSVVLIFNGLSGYVELKITGEVAGTVFEGLDTIRIID